jgi:hypothetical protein
LPSPLELPVSSGTVSLDIPPNGLALVVVPAAPLPH